MVAPHIYMVEQNGCGFHGSKLNYETKVFPNNPLFLELFIGRCQIGRKVFNKSIFYINNLDFVHT